MNDRTWKANGHLASSPLTLGRCMKVLLLLSRTNTTQCELHCRAYFKQSAAAGERCSAEPSFLSTANVSREEKIVKETSPRG